MVILAAERLEAIVHAERLLVSATATARQKRRFGPAARRRQAAAATWAMARIGGRTTAQPARSLPTLNPTRRALIPDGPPGQPKRHAFKADWTTI